MAESAKTEDTSPPRYIRWDDGEWTRVLEAAAKWSEQTHVAVRPAAFVRGAAMKWADEILGG